MTSSAFENKVASEKRKRKDNAACNLQVKNKKLRLEKENIKSDIENTQNKACTTCKKNFVFGTDPL